MVFLTSFAPTGTTPGVMGQNNSTLANYREAWERGKFLLAFANSTLVAIAVTASQIMTSALAGYALARLKFRGRQALLLVVLATCSCIGNFSHSCSVIGDSHLFGTEMGTHDKHLFGANSTQ